MPPMTIVRPRNGTSRVRRSVHPGRVGQDGPTRSTAADSTVADSEECRRLRYLASAIRCQLREVQAQEIELGEKAAAHLAYEVLRRGWGQC
jgi:hypothetical protein